MPWELAVSWKDVDCEPLPEKERDAVQVEHERPDLGEIVTDTVPETLLDWTVTGTEMTSFL